jgi:hypothetical protein
MFKKFTFKKTSSKLFLVNKNFNFFNFFFRPIQMTYLHFLVCATLTFLPPWVVYKSKLSDSNVPSNVGFAGMAHALTQLAKVLFLLT